MTFVLMLVKITFVIVAAVYAFLLGIACKLYSVVIDREKFALMAGCGWGDGRWGEVLIGIGRRTVPALAGEYRWRWVFVFYPWHGRVYRFVEAR